MSSKAKTVTASGPIAFGLNGKELLTVAILGISNLFSATAISIQAPFYPGEAMMKGATSSQVGFVFAIFHLTVFFASPIYGTLLGRTSPKLVFTLGLFCTGFCAILFGFLKFIPNHVPFITFSFILRVLEAIGHAGNVSASFTVISTVFPDNFATIFGALETTWGFGLILGPTAGGILYGLGGFTLPFFSMGFLLISTAFASHLFLSDSAGRSGSKKKLKQCGSENKKQGGNFFSLIRIPGCALAGCAILVSALSIEFLQATLEQFLRDKFELSPVSVGLFFMIDGLMYSTSAPIWGRIADSKRISSTKFVSLAGCFITFLGFLIIGPAPGIPLPSSQWTTILGLIIYGIGSGATFVSSFLIGLEDSIAAGFEDTVSTYGLVSGMWVSFLSLGAFIGPSIGGLLLENFGFESSTIFVLVAQVLMATATIVFIVGERRSQTHLGSRSLSDFDSNSNYLPNSCPKLSQLDYDQEAKIGLLLPESESENEQELPWKK